MIKNSIFLVSSLWISLGANISQGLQTLVAVKISVLKRSMNSNGLLACNEIPDWIRYIKAGDVIKATPIIEINEGLYRDGIRSSLRETSLVKKIRVEASVVKKVDVEALYRDKDGSLQLLPLTKFG
nr:TMV resistance protein N-like isoform X1 [Ipomoea batatas]